MVTIKNIAKRKELAELVYDRYVQPLTPEERKELENEVGAAYTGYGKAMAEICQIIVDGKGFAEVKQHITRMLGNAVWYDTLPTATTDRLDTIVRKELLEKGYDEDEANAIIKAFIEYPTARQSIIKKYGLNRIIEMYGEYCEISQAAS